MTKPIPDGTGYELRERVTAEMGAPHLGPAGAVLSTPSMIGLMEQCARLAMEPFLEAGERSLGVRVCITHEAAARVDDEVRVAARLNGVRDDRYIWEVEAQGPDGRRLGGGTHERVVVADGGGR